MKISKTYKILLGILTIFQLLAGLSAVIWFAAIFLPVALTGNESAIELLVFDSLGPFIIGVVVSTIISLALFIFYCIHAGTSKHLSTTMKVVWIALFFVIGAVAEVVYYFMEIRSEQSLTAGMELA